MYNKNIYYTVAMKGEETGLKPNHTTIVFLNAIKQQTEERIRDNNRKMLEGYLNEDTCETMNKAYQTVITDIDLKIEFIKEAYDVK